MLTSMNLTQLYRKVLDIAKKEYSKSKYDPDLDLYRIEDLYNSVSHNQIESKTWLVEEATHYLNDNDRICIIGAWYGVLSHMLQQYTKCIIHNVDTDPYTKIIGQKLVNDLKPKPAWYLEDGVDRYLENKDWYTVLCSTSVEHIPPKRFYELMSEKPEDTLVILQSNNNESELEHINIHDTLENLQIDSLLNDIYYSGSKEFKGTNGNYHRHMVIGR